MTTDLYRKLILEHARSPRNFRRINGSTHSAEGINPLCGDKLRLYLNIGSDEVVTDAGFEGSGCAISIASASLLTETVTNQSVENAEACCQALIRRLTVKEESDQERSNNSPALCNSELRVLDGVRKHPSRVKCATLAWQTLHAALQQQPTATTE